MTNDMGNDDAVDSDIDWGPVDADDC